MAKELPKPVAAGIVALFVLAVSGTGWYLINRKSSLPPPMQQLTPQQMHDMSAKMPAGLSLAPIRMDGGRGAPPMPPGGMGGMPPGGGPPGMPPMPGQMPMPGGGPPGMGGQMPPGGMGGQTPMAGSMPGGPPGMGGAPTSMMPDESDHHRDPHAPPPPPPGAPKDTVVQKIDPASLNKSHRKP